MKPRVAIWFAAVLFLFNWGHPCPLFAQGTLLQGGPWTPGHAPMYVGSGNGQAVVQDSGPAGGGGIGLGLSEQLLVARGTGGAVAPFANAGTGPLSTNWCDYDAPLTNPTGYHYLCFSPNAQGGGLLAYGAGGAATALPFVFNINGVPYTIAGSGLTVGATTLAGASPPRFTNGVLYDQGGVLEEYPVTGTLNAVLSNSPILTGLPTVQGLTTTSPGWYAQVTGDANARVRIGLNATDIASVAFGSGSVARDTFIERAGVATLRLGAPDAAAPVAQTLGVQNVVAGTSNTAGTAWTFSDSAGTGTAASGGYLFKTHPAGSSGTTQNAAVTALSIFGTGGLSTGAAVDEGAGTLNLQGALYNNGTAPTGTGGYVRGTSPTLVNPTFTGSVNITNTVAGGGGLLTMLDTSLTTTNSVVATIGVDNANANNSANFSFNYAGSGSANNHGCVGLFGDNQIACWDGNHNFGVNTGTNVLDKAFSVISDSNFSVDSSGNTIIGGTLNVAGITTLAFGAAGTNSVITATSGNTGAGNFFVVNNSGTISTSNTSAIVQANLSNGTNAGVSIAANGGGSPSAQLVSGPGLTGGMTIFTQAGTLTIASPSITGVATVASATATPAGGSTAARLLFGTTAGFGIYYGSGLPTVSAAQGSIYIRSDGSSSSTRLYVNSTGSTTWVNITSAS